LPKVDGATGFSQSYYSVIDENNTECIVHSGATTEEQLQSILDTNHYPYHSISRNLRPYDIYLSNYHNQTINYTGLPDSFGEYDIELVRTVFTQHGVSGLIQDVFVL
jgi:hypothetical protein